MFGAWISAAEQLRSEGQKAYKEASNFHMHSRMRRLLRTIHRYARMNVRGGENNKLSMVCMYLLAVKKGWHAMVDNRRRRIDMKLQKKVDFVLTVEQSDQQRLMKKWYHLWKTRRIHNDLVLFRFRDVMKGTIQQWLAYSRFRYLKKEEMRRQLVDSHSAFLMSLCKKSIVRFRQNVIAKKRERCFRYVDISSLDELFVRRSFQVLELTAGAAMGSTRKMEQPIQCAVNHVTL